MAIPGIPLIKSGWQTFKGHFLFVWAILGITIGISIFFNLLENRLMRATDEFLPYALFTILSFLVMLWIQLGATSIFIHLARTGEELTIDRLFSQKEIFWRALLASVAYYALVIVGFLLLIIPGIYLALRYYFLLFVIIDEKPETVGEAFKRAGALTKGKGLAAVRIHAASDPLEYRGFRGALRRSPRHSSGGYARSCPLLPLTPPQKRCRDGKRF